MVNSAYQVLMKVKLWGYLLLLYKYFKLHLTSFKNKLNSLKMHNFAKLLPEPTIISQFKQTVVYYHGGIMALIY